MEFEPWWLLAIPLFFGLGWLAARTEARPGAAAAGTPGLPAAYFRGLNHLLNEQPDKAIDAFVDVVSLDPETTELHFALGNLFRRRGETDRAIRVHQNLLERRDLAPAQRELALYHLGQDFLKAGLLDRAEQAFDRLDGTPHEADALRHRRDLAQMVRDWPRAIEFSERLARQAGEDPAVHRRELAHYRCEIAAAALACGAPEAQAQAREALSLAAEAAPDHPRPWLLAGQAAWARGEALEAIRAWRELANRAPQHLGLVAEPWIAAHRAAGLLDEGIAALEQVQAEAPGVDTFGVLLEARIARDGLESARAWAEAQMRVAPSLLGLDHWLRLEATQADERQRREIDLVRFVLGPQAGRLARYVCNHCGFKARTYQWQCPGCARWDTYAPRRSEEIGPQ